jgi:hypothetical protein
MQPWAMVWKSQSPRLRQNLPKSLPHALEKARASQARPWLMNPKKGNLGLISSKQMLTSTSQDLTFKVHNDNGEAFWYIMTTEIAAPKPDPSAKAKKKHDFEALFRRNFKRTITSAKTEKIC